LKLPYETGFRQIAVPHFVKGWELKRVNGSHHIYVFSGRPERLSVPVHGNQPLKLGLLKSLLKTPGIDESGL